MKRALTILAALTVVACSADTQTSKTHDFEYTTPVIESTSWIASARHIDDTQECSRQIANIGANVTGELLNIGVVLFEADEYVAESVSRLSCVLAVEADEEVSINPPDELSSWIVTFHLGTNFKRCKREVARLASITSALPRFGIVVVETDQSSANAIEQLPCVQAVEVDGVNYPNPGVIISN